MVTSFAGFRMEDGRRLKDGSSYPDDLALQSGGCGQGDWSAVLDSFMSVPYDAAAFLSRVNYVLSNRKLRQLAVTDMKLQVQLGDRIHQISSEPRQILDLLISTYEDAIRINGELVEKQKELALLAAGLERQVEERTAALRAEFHEHQIATEQLRQSEEQFRLIAENTADLIAVLDLDGKRLLATVTSYKDILGAVLKRFRDPVRSMKFTLIDREKGGRFFKEPSARVVDKERSTDSCSLTGACAISSHKGASSPTRKAYPQGCSSSRAM